MPAVISPTQSALTQARLRENRRFAARHTKVPSLLQGLLVCRTCGYAYYRTSPQTSRRKLYYYRCLGSDNYRYPEGRRCRNRPVRQDALDTLVWDEVIRLLESPSLVRQEIDRRLAALRTEHPVTAKRESLVKALTRIRGAAARLIEAYQEELLSLEELRTRMPPLRQREATAAAQLATLEAELVDAETYVAQNLEGFLDKLHEAAHTLAVADRQRVVRLLLKEVQVGPDTLTAEATALTIPAASTTTAAPTQEHEVVDRPSLDDLRGALRQLTFCELPNYLAQRSRGSPDAPVRYGVTCTADEDARQLFVSLLSTTLRVSSEQAMR